MAHIRYHKLDSQHVFFYFFYFLIEGINVIAEFFHGGDFIIGIFLVPLQLADFFCDRIAFIFHRFDALQQITALSVQGDKGIDVSRLRVTVPDVFLDFFHMVTDKFRI